MEKGVNPACFYCRMICHTSCLTLFVVFAAKSIVSIHSLQYSQSSFFFNVGFTSHQIVPYCPICDPFCSFHSLNPLLQYSRSIFFFNVGFTSHQMSLIACSISILSNLTALLMGDLEARQTALCLPRNLHISDSKFISDLQF